MADDMRVNDEFNALTAPDPKNMQELTHYVSRLAVFFFFFVDFPVIYFYVLFKN